MYLYIYINISIPIITNIYSQLHQPKKFRDSFFLFDLYKIDNLCKKY